MRKPPMAVRRPAIVIFALFCLFTILVTPSIRAQTILEYWSPWSGIWQEMQEQIVAEFNASHPNIQVNYVLVPSDVYIERMILAQTPPDVMVIWGFKALELAPEGVLSPLDQWIERDLNTDEFYPAALEQYRWNGRTWAAAYGAAGNALIYNSQLFDEAGIGEPPATFDEVKETARKITRAEGDGTVRRMGYLPLHAMWGGFLNFSYLFGGSYYDTDTDNLTVSHPSNIAALTWIEEYINELGGQAAVDGFYAVHTGQEPFLTGSLGMQLSHSWYTAQIHKLASDLEYGVADAPLHQGPGPGKGPLLGSDSLVIPDRAPHPEEAWTFLRWMMTEGQKRWAEIQGIHSAWILGQPQWETPVPPGTFDVYSRSAGVARPIPPIPAADYLIGRLNAHVSAVLRGESWPQKALEDVSIEVQARLDEILGNAN